MRIITDESSLRLSNNSIKIFELKEIINTAKQMVKFMILEKGIGLAAPQIGIHKTFFVARISGEYCLFINPQIIKSSKETNVNYEGCLSIPGYHGTVERPNTIQVKYNNGLRTVIATLSGLDARVYCHEYDHIIGVLYPDKAIEVIEDEQPTEKMG